MKIIKLISQLFILCIPIASVGGLESSSWTFIPEEDEGHESPWRLLFVDEDTFVSESLFAGVKRESRGSYLEKDGEIECTIGPDRQFLLIVSERPKGGRDHCTMTSSPLVPLGQWRLPCRRKRPSADCAWSLAMW